MAGKTYRGPRAIFNYNSALKGYIQHADKPIVSGLRKGIRQARQRARRVFVAHGVGRTIWGRDVNARGNLKKGSNLGPLFSTRRIKRQGEHYVSGFTLLGIPALVQVGGRTKEFKIPRTANTDLAGGAGIVIAFSGAGVGTYAFASGAKPILHKGSPLRYARDFAGKELRRGEPDVKRFTEAALVKSAQLAGVA